MILSLSTPPSQFIAYNQGLSKQLNVVVDIQGLPIISSLTTYRTLRYGDSGALYGGAGLLYGGLVAVGFNVAGGERQQKNLLLLDGGNLTIQQRLEPEQGRGSISTLTLSFLDQNGYMTQVCSPGVIIDEILGRQVKVWIGYSQTSFPGDYYVVWRGRVAQVNAEPAGKISLQFVDPNIVRKQQVFYCGQTELTAGIDNAVTTIPVTANSNFFQKILGPSGSYDGAVRTFIKIDDEFIEYQQTGHESDGFGANQFLHVLRGSTPLTNMATPSVAAAHSSGATVDGYIMLSGHAMDLALKIMLSGWNGAFLSGQSIYSFVTTDDSSLPTVSNGIVLSADTDAIRDLGISIGDYITISGGLNNGIYVTVVGFTDLTNQPNRVVLCSANFTAEDPSAATISVRSQYDTLPILAGCQLPGWEVDVGAFQYYRNTFLLDSSNQYQFFINSTGESGKTFIESEILLPLGAYSLTRQGKISMGLTKPPIADQRTQTVTGSNVVDPMSVNIQRGLNNRKFFNEVDWSFDCDETATPTSQRNTVSSASLTRFSNYSSVLPITSRGARTELGFLNVVSNREAWLFNRYQYGSILVDAKVNLTIGALIEVGDVVILSDNGTLKLPNFTTGSRDFGTQYMEVINRSLDLKTGQVQLQLEGGVGSTISDRYATISQSSVLTGSSSNSRLVISDSFGPEFPTAEYKKWQAYTGLNVRVRSTDYLVSGTTTFTGFDPSNNYALLLSPALSFTPTAGMIVELAQYPTNATASDQAYAKLIHTFLTPSVKVTAAISHTQFQVGAGDAAKFIKGQPIILHNVTYSKYSPELTISAVSGTTITLSGDPGFLPDASITCELLGFADSGQPYRFV